MIYLETSDLTNYIQERFIEECSQGDDDIIDKLELVQISIVKTLIGSRYGVNVIFYPDAPIFNEVLKSIIARMLLYRLVKRNAARNAPTNIKDEYDAAIKELNEIATGKVRLEGLPGVNDNSESGSTSNSLWGNNKNQDFYI